MEPFSDKGAADNEDCGHADGGGQLVYKRSPSTSFKKIIVATGMLERIRHWHHFKAQRYLDAMFFIFGLEIIHSKILSATFAGHGAIFAP
jgi:hypothetical protein